MATLYLIRHGKASPSSDDYDVLSEIGIEQSRRLGRHLASGNVRFDSVYVGPLRRQQDTFEHMARDARHAGLQWPRPISMPELAEAPLVTLMKECMPRRAAGDPALAELAAQAGRAKGEPERGERLMRLIRYMIELWIRDELEAPGVERYGDFCSRVEEALHTLASRHGPDERVAVVTSLGVIAWMLQAALQADPQETVERSARLANASITELVLASDGAELERFADVSFLDDASLVTYL